MTLTLELPDDHAAALKSRAAAQGMTLETWLQKLTGNEAIPKAALDWSECSAVESVPGRVSGTWVFRNTRLPVTAVFENLEDGVSIDELIGLYAGLTRDQVEAVLDFAARSLKTPMPAQVNACPF